MDEEQVVAEQPPGDRKRSRHDDRDGDRNRDRDRGDRHHRSRRDGDREDRDHHGKEDRHRRHHHRSSHHQSGGHSKHHRSRDERDPSDRRQHRDHHHRSSHHHHGSKRRRHSRDGDGKRRTSRKDDRDGGKGIGVVDDDASGGSGGSGSEVEDGGEGMWVEKGADVDASNDAPSSAETAAAAAPKLKRDAWMEEGGLEFDFTQRGAKKSQQQQGSTSRQTVPDYKLSVSSKELNVPLREGMDLDNYEAPVSKGADYEFGDSGSQWRMVKLKNVYSTAKEQGRDVDDVGEEVFGELRLFDAAREERQELDRREMYGRDRKDYKSKPTGELYASRKFKEEPVRSKDLPVHGQVFSTTEEPKGLKSAPLDQTALNKLRAELLKAKVRGGSKAAELEAKYNLAMAEFANNKEPEVIVLSAMDSRVLAGGGKSSESVEIKTGRRKGQLETNQGMTVDDMVREEKRTRGQVNEGKLFAERISKDTRFTDDLEYMDENADRLANRVQKREVDLKNMAINEFQKMQKILDSCPLCQNDDRPPVAPVVSLATRVFLTLPTEPQLSPGGATIVPIQHRTNTLECDDDEWEEIRNFMKCLIKMYHDQGRDVIFYENAAAPHRRRHATIEAVPLPQELGAIAPAFFKEAFVSSDEEWSQHKKIIDTLSLSKKGGMGKQAFRRAIVKEAPYFHVWFEIGGGMGHLVEDENRWPKGDLFAREVIGGMLDCEPDVIKRQGRWVKGKDPREERFRKTWTKFDWTKVLQDG